MPIDKEGEGVRQSLALQDNTPLLESAAKQIHNVCVCAWAEARSVCRMVTVDTERNNATGHFNLAA